jgi:uncharacterized membrane protein (UPF0127 family)
VAGGKPSGGRSVRIASTGRALAERVEVADDFIQRMAGLLGRRSLPAGSGLLLSPCDSVHMLFMRFPIDVVFLDSENRVVKVAHSLAPWRLAFGGRGARKALELPAGTARGAGVGPGERLLFE